MVEGGPLPGEREDVHVPSLWPVFKLAVAPEELK
jgi:hypothetical protein